ncbi:hypothetical protein ACKWTF_004338 [Chironomus riparius]
MGSFDPAKLNMNYFFDEILIEIFGNLSLQMLKNCRLVCKRWDQLIINNKHLLKNLQVVLRTSKDIKKFAEIRRMPKDVIILDDQGFSMNVFDHLHNLHSLIIDLRPCQAYLEPSHFKEILSSATSLKILYASDLNFNGDIQNMKECEKINLNLTELRCNSELINILKCTTLKILDLRWHWNLPEDRKTNVINFLSQQKKLEDLTLNCRNYFYDHFQHFNYEFQLKSFTFFSNCNFSDHKSFIRYLEPHKHSLQSLNIQMFSFEQSKVAIEEIFKFIMRNLSNLKELELDTVFKGTIRKIEVLPLQLNNFSSNTIERFGFNDIFYSMDDNKQLIDLLPNMKHLSIKSCFCKVVELLEYVASTKPQLESLQVYNFDCVDSAIKFTNLKEFSVHTFSTSIQALSSFLARNSKSLERINIGDAANICQQAVNAISKCENLKCLTVNVTNNNLRLVMKTFLGILNRDKPLKIIFKDYPSIKTFMLPEDKIIWKKQIRLN